MRLISRHIICLLLVLNVMSAFAQNVGYMGKKFSVDLGAQVVPSFTNLILEPPWRVIDSTTGEKIYYKQVSLKIYPEINISRTLSRNWDISLRYCYQTFKIFYKSVQVYSNTNSYYSSYYVNNFMFKDGMNAIAKSSLYEISLRYNAKQFIAPIGTYFNFGFGMYRSKLDKPSVVEGGYYPYVYNNGGNLYPALEDKDLKNEIVNMKRISLGMHFKKIITNSFYYDLGLETSVLFARQYKQAHYGEITERQLEQTFIPDMQRRYLQYENLFSLKVAVGLLF